MDEKLDLILKQPLIVVPIGLAVLGVLAWRGALGPRALLAGPRRAIGLGAMDLLVGITLFLLMGTLFQLLASLALREVSAGGSPPMLMEAPPMLAVGLIVLGQLLTQAPPVAYLAWRAGWCDGPFPECLSRRGATPGGAARGLVRIGLLPRSPGRELGLGLVGFVAAMPIVLMLMVLGAVAGILVGQPVPELAHDLLRLLVSTQMPPAGKAMLMISAVVLGPALEEMIYRGLLQSSVSELLGGRRRWTAIFIVATLFAVMHLGAARWQALPALLGLGVILGWLYERSGSLWPPILVHTLFNAFNIGLALLIAGPVDTDVPMPV